MNLLSAFGGGLWIIPVGLLLAAIWSAYRGFRASKSGSVRQIPGGGTEYSKENVGYFKTAGGWFSVIFLIAAIASAIIMYNER